MCAPTFPYPPSRLRRFGGRDRIAKHHKFVGDDSRFNIRVDELKTRDREFPQESSCSTVHPRGTHLVMDVVRRHIVSVRLRQIVSWWFILQIVVPFTAPLQTLDVLDLFGGRSHHHSQTLPESTTTPTMSEAGAAGSIVPLLSSTPLPAHDGTAAACDPAGHTLLACTFDLPLSRRGQQSVLRL